MWIGDGMGAKVEPCPPDLIRVNGNLSQTFLTSAHIHPTLHFHSQNGVSVSICGCQYWILRNEAF